MIVDINLISVIVHSSYIKTQILVTFLANLKRFVPDSVSTFVYKKNVH